MSRPPHFASRHVTPPGDGLLTTIGGILILIGAILWLLGATGRAVGGRKHFF
ncbi:DUF6131 family protein [Streptomyces massasporeus]|uniref:DUF6131 family protein n=1 Tax=Streptomyces massasporeus TaxID=67324 RepID=UPI003688F5FF